MSGHWHLMDRKSPWTVERQPFPTMQAVIHVKSVRAALGQPDPAVLFQTEPWQTCRWCAQQQSPSEQPVTCANCHQVIVAEEGDTCASIPAWRRGRFDYCDTATVEEEQPMSPDPNLGTDVMGTCPACDAQDCDLWNCDHECHERMPERGTVPERAPAGMLAVRVGSDPWTMVPLDNDTSPVGWDVIDTSTD